MTDPQANPVLARAQVEEMIAHLELVGPVKNASFIRVLRSWLALKDENEKWRSVARERSLKLARIRALADNELSATSAKQILAILDAADLSDGDAQRKA